LQFEKLVKKLKDLDTNNKLSVFITSVEKMYGKIADINDFDNILSTILRPPINTLFPFYDILR